ncbi:hypothetical protein NDA01_29215 [Trichocoleus desertorum AS-A10]|uniref:hypothetical protein n=1 Tax=Trichocoleus desertorum TaxID=1481672 RepID=UPI00329942EC
MSKAEVGKLRLEYRDRNLARAAQPVVHTPAGENLGKDGSTKLRAFKDLRFSVLGSLHFLALHEQ